MTVSWKNKPRHFELLFAFMSKKLATFFVIFLLLLLAGGIFWWRQSQKETKELGAKVQVEVKTKEQRTTAELEDGAKIILPAGSVAVGTVVTARFLDPAVSPELPEWATRAILLYEFNVNQSLQNPATIQIPLPKNNELSLLGHYYDGFWEIIPFTVEEGVALIEVEHFSVFGWLGVDGKWFISFLEKVGPPSEKALEMTFGNIIKTKKWVEKKQEESVHWLFGGKADEFYHKASVALKLIKAIQGRPLAYAELLESGELDRMRESLESSEDSRYETRLFEWLMEGGPKRKDDWRVSDFNQNKVVLKLYRENHGDYPDSLSDLSPEYWSATQDPITGNPYAYARCISQGKNCYTLGANLVSNHISLQNDVDVATCSLSDQTPLDCSDTNFHYCVENCVKIEKPKEETNKQESLSDEEQDKSTKEETQKQKIQEELQTTQTQPKKPQVETKTLPHKITAYVIDQHGKPFKDAMFIIEDADGCTYCPPAGIEKILSYAPEDWSVKENKLGSKCLHLINSDPWLAGQRQPACNNLTSKDGYLESVLLPKGEYTLYIPSYHDEYTIVQHDPKIIYNKVYNSYRQKISVPNEGIFLDKIKVERGYTIFIKTSPAWIEIKEKNSDYWQLLCDISSAPHLDCLGDNAEGHLESEPLEEGDYTIRIKDGNKETLFQKNIQINGADVDIGEIKIEEPKDQQASDETLMPPKISGFIKNQHGEVVQEADFWLTDSKGNKYGEGRTGEYGYSSQTGYFEIDTKSLAEGDYILHIEKNNWQGLTRIPYCDPYEQKISVTKKDISLGTIAIKKWSKITAKIVDESGSPIDGSGLCSGFEVIDKEGHSTYYYSTYLSHAGDFNQYGYLETYPLADGEYTLRIKIIWNCPLGEYTIVERKINISGNDIALGEIAIPPE